MLVKLVDRETYVIHADGSIKAEMLKNYSTKIIDSETFEISFPADFDGKRIKCLVDTDALQDINTSNATDTAESQFNDNKYSFQSIAEEKI